MPRCEYSYYATLLSCNKFYREPQGGTRALTGGPLASGHPLEPSLTGL